MKKYIILVLTTLLGFSCSGYLDEKVYSDVTGEIFTDSEESANLLTDGVVGLLVTGQFFQWGNYFNVAEKDNDYIYAGSWAMGGYGGGNFTHESGVVDDWWKGRYTLIYRANYAIEKISAMNSFSEEVKNNMLGQLLFLKGWAYFQLVQAYGPLVLHKERAATVEAYQKPREPIVDVYSYIIDCLNRSGHLLFEKSHPRYEKGRISKYAAKTLLAHVYCTMGSGSLPAGTEITVIGGPVHKEGVDDRITKPIPITHKKDKVAGYDFDPNFCYTRAKELCDSIMVSGEFTLYSDWNELWDVKSRNGGEFIWQLQNSMSLTPNGFATGISGYKPKSEEVYIKNLLFGMRDHWYELFGQLDSDDKYNDVRARDGVYHLWAERAIDWESDIKGTPWWFCFPVEDRQKILNENPDLKSLQGHGTYCFLTKFRGVPDQTEINNDYHYPFLRYPLVYFILAEAENELGNTIKAKEVIDIIRTRAKATLTSSRTMNQQEVRSFILEERSRELAMEGFRKWDLLRWGIYLQVMNAIGMEDGQLNKSRQPRNLLLPIPLQELNSNRLIGGNNPGW